MGLEIQVDPASRWVIATEALWLTADRSRLVPAGDREAAFLFTLPGRRVSLADAGRYGLVPASPVAAAELEPEAEPVVGGLAINLTGEEPAELAVAASPEPAAEPKPRARRAKKT